MLNNKQTRENRILIHKELYDSGKATKFCLRAQKIRGMKVRGWTEIWVPNKAFTKKYRDECILVEDWFYNKLVFV